jgi:hypothetical protein
MLNISDHGDFGVLFFLGIHADHPPITQQAQFLKVTELVSDPPSPRSSATLIASPANTKELFLFGGEYYNGALATFFNDLFVYHIEKDEWRRVTSPNSPLPRSGHAWCRGGNSGGIYLFGGLPTHFVRKILFRMLKAEYMYQGNSRPQSKEPSTIITTSGG